eukprot:4292214-Heterocapsa_arctica.AAC.1
MSHESARALTIALVMLRKMQPDRAVPGIVEPLRQKTVGLTCPFVQPPRLLVRVIVKVSDMTFLRWGR